MRFGGSIVHECNGYVVPAALDEEKLLWSATASETKLNYTKPLCKRGLEHEPEIEEVKSLSCDLRGGTRAFRIGSGASKLHALLLHESGVSRTAVGGRLWL